MVKIPPRAKEVALDVGAGLVGGLIVGKPLEGAIIAPILGYTARKVAKQEVGPVLLGLAATGALAVIAVVAGRPVQLKACSSCPSYRRKWD